MPTESVRRLGSKIKRALCCGDQLGLSMRAVRCESIELALAEDLAICADERASLAETAHLHNKLNITISSDELKRESRPERMENRISKMCF